jgi:hypothetical protein
MRFLPFSLVVLLAGTAAAAPTVKLVPHPAEQRVDVLVDGKPFTAYRWAPELKKPVLFPVRSARGTVVTRGAPLEPRTGESTDHPHHIGLWLNFGDVNGVDFWGNGPALKGAAPKKEEAAKTEAPKGEVAKAALKTEPAKGAAKAEAPKAEPARAPRKIGTVVHRGISRLEEGPGRGALAVTADWLDPEGKPLMREETIYVFTAGERWRGIDRLTKLTAGNDAVIFPDNKEGMLGLRVASALEATSKKNAGGTGLYRSSEGKTGDEVWGTRGRWVTLTGTAESEPLTIAVLDHPNNPGFPTHWHARGYGLFAANPLGGKAMNKDEPAFNFTIPPSQSARFSYRILVLPGAAAPAEIEAQYKQFVAAY